MRKALLLAALAALVSLQASAAETLRLQWTNPTTSIDGVPLTGPNAITAIEVYCATSPIADDATIAPIATLGAVATGQVSMSVNRGDTIYCRVKAVNASGKSPFSNMASKQIPLSTIPNAPTELRIDLVILPPGQ